MPPMVHVENLTKYYGTYVGIEDVSFSIERGEVIGFLGPNGAGKTTTMRVLTCSMPATRGTARVAGYDVLRDSIEVRRCVGYLPESPPLYPEMTVGSFLRFVGTIKGVPRRSLGSRLSYVLDVCGLADITQRIVGQLSKGYRQRVAIAQALIHDPSVLIFDEPTSGLDPAQRIEIRDLIHELGRDRTVILSTHILAEAQRTCQRLLIIAEGRIAGDIQLDAEGEVVSVETPGGGRVDYSARKVTVEAGGDPNAVQETLRDVPGIQSVEGAPEADGRRWTITAFDDCDIRPDVASSLVGAGFPIFELREERPSLERLFLALTQRQPEREKAKPGLDTEPAPVVEGSS